MKMHLFALSSLVTVSLTFALVRNEAHTQRTLERVLRAMEEGLKFLGREYRRVNLDAIIGTRILDGQLQVLLRRLLSNNTGHTSNVPRILLQKIARAQQLAEYVSDKSVPWIAKNQPKYYAKIGTLLDNGFWQLDYASRNVDTSLYSPPLYIGESMKEVQSDNCLAEFFGTGKRKKEKCSISTHCWDLMTAPGYRRYSLSHEVFYLEIGEVYGCFSDRMLGLNDLLNAAFCTNMLAEAEELVHQGYPHRWRDLFMEQAALCGILGYREFFRSDWLEQILSWQRPKGCFGSHIPHRVKREERQFEDGCQCHKTAVAVAALGQYVRYLIEYLEIQKSIS